MNKAQLIDAIAEKAGLSKADSKKALEAFVATIGESLKKDEKVALLVSDLSLYLKEVQEQVEIRKPGKQSKFRLRRW